MVVKNRIEHSKLEFTLALKVRPDPHIVAQIKATQPPPAPPKAVQQLAAPPPSKGGMRSFFSSPKRPPKAVAQPVRVPPKMPEFKLPENLARYLKPDGTLARAFVQFKDIAGRCDTRMFETSYPLIGQRLDSPGGRMQPMQIGQLVLRFLRIPILAGVPAHEQPQSLEEASRGLKYMSWHKTTYFEGTLTQYGGDCSVCLHIFLSSGVGYED